MGDFDFNHIDKSKWKKYRFEQIAKSIGERVEPKQTDLEVYVGLEHIDSDSVHIKRTGVPSDVEGTKLRVYPGDVIFGKRRAYQRKAAIATFDGICSAHAMVLRAIESVIDPKLFPFFLHSDYFMDRAIDISVGSLSPTINWGTLKTQEFLLPPKDQQAKLAELLWAADEAVELKDELRRQLKSLINLEVEKYNHAKYKKSNLGDVLQRKKEVSLPPHLREKYIGLENIESGSFTCLGFSSSTDAIANCFCFDEGDLLYSKLRPYLDKVFIASFSGVCTTELMVYNVVNAESDYVLQTLHSASFINYVNSKSFGTKMPRVSHEIVSSYPAYIPTVKEQKKIADKLKIIRNNAEGISNDILKIRQIQKQLINQIFSA